MQKIVINACYGGFGLSYKGVMSYADKKGFTLYAFVDERDKNHKCIGFRYYDSQKDTKEYLIHYSKKPLKNKKYEEGSCFYPGDIERNDPALIAVVEELKEEANGSCAELKIVEIPDDVIWEIDEYDGWESVEEKTRHWC